MTWVAWRQFRAQAALAVVSAAAVTIVLVTTRNHVASDPEHLSPTYQSLRLLGTALIGLPAFIGAFWGAPLIARELEAGTHRLIWTQGITRARWLAVRLAVVGAVTIALCAGLSLLFTWWSLPFDRLGNRIGTANFGQRGVAPVAYALFALTLGALLGVVTRRTLPAMAGTLLGFFVVRFTVQWVVRPRLVAPVWMSRPSTLFGPPRASSASGGWVLGTRTVDAAGHVVSTKAVENAVARACPILRDTSPRDMQACTDRLGFHDLVRVQPGSRFWLLQGWESALFLVLAALLAATCFWWLRNRVT